MNRRLRAELKRQEARRKEQKAQLTQQARWDELDKLAKQERRRLRPRAGTHVVSGGLPTLGKKRR